MGKRGEIRKLFPASNTGEGFYSFFDYIIELQGRRLFILKGGPGVGKSTFMREIEEYVLEHGLDVEEFHCSSDPDSLDAVAIPELKVALVDGTAPHIIDPKNPGITDEIIPLGDYWEREKLADGGEQIISLNKKIGKLFKIAYNQLREARVAYDEWKGYVQDGLDSMAYKRAVHELLKSIFSDMRGELGEGKSRHLFAAAITPKGLSSYIDTLIKRSMRVYAVEGMPGSGAKEALGAIAAHAEVLGLDIEQLHCPFEPEMLNMIIIPSLQVSVIYMTGFDTANQELLNGVQLVEKINFDSLLNWNNIEEYKEELEDAQDRWNNLIKKAVDHIARAQALHRELEQHYIKAMDFSNMELKKEEVLNEIIRIINSR